MKKFLLFLISLVFIYTVFLVLPGRISAQCSSDTCDQVYVEWTHECTQDENYPKQCTQGEWRCSYGYSGGGCTCCYENQCVAYCPGDGGDGGDGEDGPYCGDGSCNGAETCTNCAGDCGSCPTGNVQIRAAVVPAGTSTCAQVEASSTFIASDYILYPSGLSGSSTAGGGYVTWNNQTVYSPYTTYGFADTPPADYVYTMACWNRDLPAPVSGSGAAADLYDGSTLTWTVAYTAGAGWTQAVGGDVYAADSIRSYIPTLASPRRFLYLLIIDNVPYKTYNSYRL